MKNNKGITLIALTITIIVLLIIASVGTYSGIDALLNAREEAQTAELDMLQHVILENYSKYLVTHNLDKYIIGEPKTYSYVKGIINEINNELEDGKKISLKSSDYDSETDTEDKKLKQYYLLKTAHLQSMSIDKVNSEEYIVNYKTGEVINVNAKITKTGKPLYVYAVEN